MYFIFTLKSNHTFWFGYQLHAYNWNIWLDNLFWVASEAIEKVFNNVLPRFARAEINEKNFFSLTAHNKKNCNNDNRTNSIVLTVLLSEHLRLSSPSHWYYLAQQTHLMEHRNYSVLLQNRNQFQGQSLYFFSYLSLSVCSAASSKITARVTCVLIDAFSKIL